MKMNAIANRRAPTATPRVAYCLGLGLHAALNCVRILYITAYTIYS